MIRSAKILCWLCVSILLIGIGALYRFNPSLVGGLNFIPLLPFALTLIAFYSNPNRLLILVAIVVNAFVVLLGIVLFGVGLFGQFAVPWVGMALGLMFVFISSLNFIALKSSLPAVTEKNG